MTGSSRIDEFGWGFMFCFGAEVVGFYRIWDCWFRVCVAKPEGDCGFREFICRVLALWFEVSVT